MSVKSKFSIISFVFLLFVGLLSWLDNITQNPELDVYTDGIIVEKQCRKARSSRCRRVMKCNIKYIFTYDHEVALLYSPEKSLQRRIKWHNGIGHITTQDVKALLNRELTDEDLIEYPYQYILGSSTHRNYGRLAIGQKVPIVYRENEPWNSLLLLD